MPRASLRPFPACAALLSLLACGCYEQPQPAGVEIAAVETGQVLTAHAASAETRPSAEPAPAAPARPQQVYAERTPEAAQLATWASDTQAEAEVRYTSLRRLEADHPDAAVETALALLGDETSLVRLNAIAVLQRSADPRAAQALAGLTGRDQRLAQALAKRRTR